MAKNTFMDILRTGLEAFKTSTQAQIASDLREVRNHLAAEDPKQVVERDRSYAAELRRRAGPPDEDFLRADDDDWAWDHPPKPSAVYECALQSVRRRRIAQDEYDRLCGRVKMRLRDAVNPADRTTTAILSFLPVTTGHEIIGPPWFIRRCLRAWEYLAEQRLSRRLALKAPFLIDDERDSDVDPAKLINLKRLNSGNWDEYKYSSFPDRRRVGRLNETELKSSDDQSQGSFSHSEVQELFQMDAWTCTVILANWSGVTVDSEGRWNRMQVRRLLDESVIVSLRDVVYRVSLLEEGRGWSNVSVEKSCLLPRAFGDRGTVWTEEDESRWREESE